MLRALHNREISACELMTAHLERIARVNGKLNAIVTLDCERALAEARAADHGPWRGPLHGLPIAHKDLCETKGMRTTFGSPIFRDYVGQCDDPVVEALRRAGAITIGKTNTPEFGAGSQTFNPVFGSTRNPYDFTKTSGGSSGGAAVALASGMVPLADGSDMGGSLRNPASFCNVVGFRRSTDPGRELSTPGPMARNVEDAALMLSAIDGVAPPPLERDFKNVRIAWPGQIPDIVFDSRVWRVVDAQRKAFESLGCIVEDVAPDFGNADLVFRTLRAWTYVQKLGPLYREHRAQMKASVISEIERGMRLTESDAARAESGRRQICARVSAFMDRYEYIVLPTVQVLPFDLNLEYPREIEGAPMQSYIDWMRSCYYVTVTAAPAISVPCGFSDDGLPVGLQIVGRHGSDAAVLQLAHAFEQATGFANQHPSD